MKISRLQLLKLSESFDGEFDISDFSDEELEELLNLENEGLSTEEIKKRYFEFYDDIKDRTLNKHKWSD